jgi:hypothetical protein
VSNLSSTHDDAGGSSISMPMPYVVGRSSKPMARTRYVPPALIIPLTRSCLSVAIDRAMVRVRPVAARGSSSSMSTSLVGALNAICNVTCF